MTSDTKDLTGKTLGSQFEVTRKIGEGGMGQVYLARQLDMDREVVIKVMHPELTAGSSDAVERFKREARAVARLNHPHIVQVYVFGTTDQGLLYLAMEFIEGKSLADVLEALPRMPEPQALRIMDQVCSALAEAHGNGLVHRDLKPDNVMLAQRHGNPDYVKVLDFGIAKMMGPGDASMTQTGSVFGTPQYMAPEQAKGVEVDARADLYALGVMLYEMLTGAHPFHADTAMGFLVQHMTEPVQPPTTRFPAIAMSPRTQTVVMRCLEKEPARRFQSAAELQHEIRVALQDQPSSVRGYPTSPERGSLDVHAATVNSLPRVTPAQGGAAAPHSNVEKGATGGSKSGGMLPFLIAAGAALFALIVGAAGIGWYLFSDSEPETAVAAPGSGGGAAAEPGAADPDVGSLPEAGEPMQGLPVPAESRLVSRTAQAITISTPLEREAVLRFYAHHGRSWGDVTRYPQGLQFGGSASPVSFVSVSPMPGGLSISLMLTGQGLTDDAPPEAAGVFGAPLPEGAVEYMRTGDTAIFHVPGAADPVLAFYRQRFGADTEVTLIQTQAAGGAYMVINAEEAGRPFKTIAVMVTPESMRAGGPSMQVTIVKAD